MPVGETVTLDDGSYRLEDIPDGYYVVCAVVAQACGWEGDRLNWEVEEQRIVEFDIRMKPLIATSGIVQNAEGRPIPGARVVILERGGFAPILARLMPIETDGDGRYVIGYLWDGAHTIEVSAEDYAPSVLESVQAGTSGNDVVLYVGGRISGRVTLKDTREPARDILVVAKNLEGGGDQEGKTDDEGSYSLDRLSCGVAYAIVVEHDSAGYVAIETPTVTLRDREDTSGVDIVLSRGGSVSGKVTVKETGEPLPGAKVSIAGLPSLIRRETISGRDGTFTCSMLSAGEYVVKCEHPAGFVNEKRGSARRVSVAPEEDVVGVEFSLERGGSIAGRVMDLNMEGIEGAEVRALSSGATRKSSFAKSDEEGKYRLTGIAQRQKRRQLRYRVSARARAYVGLESEPIVMPPEGDITDVDFILENGASISGRVVDTEGYVVKDARIELMSEQGDTRLSHDEPRSRTLVPWPPAQTDEEGRFEIDGIGEGKYCFRVEVHSADHGYSQMAKNDPITVRADETITDVEVVVEAAEGGVIEGYARDEAGRGILGVTVFATIGRDSTAFTKTDSSGCYRLEGLSGGTGEILFRHGSYVDARLEGVAVGTRNADAVMLRKRHGGSISGVVRDAATRRTLETFDVAVTRVQKDDAAHVPSGRGRRGKVSVVGGYVIEDVAPGTATLRATAPGYLPQEISDIIVESGQITTEVDIYLVPAAIIEGFITRDDGKPVTATQWVTVFSLSDPNQEVARAGTASDGFYRVDSLIGDTYTVVAHFRTGKRVFKDSATVQIRTGEIARVDFEMGITAGIMGTVSSPQGYGVVGVIVRPASETVPFSFQNWPSLESETVDYVLCQADGTYEIADLPAGSYNVTAVCAPDTDSPAEEIRQVSQIVTVEEGLVVDLDFSL